MLILVVAGRQGHELKPGLWPWGQFRQGLPCTCKVPVLVAGFSLSWQPEQGHFHQRQVCRVVGLVMSGATAVEVFHAGNALEFLLELVRCNDCRGGGGFERIVDCFEDRGVSDVLEATFGVPDDLSEPAVCGLCALLRRGRIADVLELVLVVNDYPAGSA